MNEHLPVHIHISKGDPRAKFYLVPEIELVLNDGFKVNEIREIIGLLLEHRVYIIQKWYEVFS